MAPTTGRVGRNGHHVSVSSNSRGAAPARGAQGRPLVAARSAARGRRRMAARTAPPTMRGHDGRPRTTRRGAVHPLAQPVEGAEGPGDRHRPVHRLRGMRDLLPPRRHRLQPRAGRLPAVPPRGRARPRRLHARPEGLHLLHPGLPPLRHLGGPGRRPPVRPHPHRRRGGRHHQDILLTRASDATVLENGQDGGLVSAILIWAMEHDYIDAALVSYLEGDRGSWKTRPASPPPRSRCWSRPAAATPTPPTPSPRRGPRGRPRAPRAGGDELPELGAAGDVEPQDRQGRQAVRVQPRPAVLQDLRRRHLRGAVPGQVRPRARADRQDEHQGRVPDLDHDGKYHEVNLKECHAWTRDGCNHCPDFAAEHADISSGGIGENNDWTLTIVRTELGREIISRMIDQGVIEARPGDSDPGAIALMRKLAERSRSRWPTTAEVSVRMGVPEGVAAH